MHGLLDIKRLEREALGNYIHKLFFSLPVAILTDVDKVRERTIWEKIENAESEYALI